MNAFGLAEKAKSKTKIGKITYKYVVFYILSAKTCNAFITNRENSIVSTGVFRQ